MALPGMAAYFKAGAWGMMGSGNGRMCKLGGPGNREGKGGKG